MKKLVYQLFGVIVFIVVTSSKVIAEDTIPLKIASYSGGTFSYELGARDVSDYLSDAATALGYSATLDTFYIDDNAPTIDSAVAYFTIIATKSDGGHVHLGFYLTKDTRGGVDYYITNAWSSASKAAVCESQDKCTGCDKLRHHWWSAAYGCNCNGGDTENGWCKFTSGDLIDTIIGIISPLLPFLPHH